MENKENGTHPPNDVECQSTPHPHLHLFFTHHPSHSTSKFIYRLPLRQPLTRLSSAQT